MKVAIFYAFILLLSNSSQAIQRCEEVIRDRIWSPVTCYDEKTNTQIVISATSGAASLASGINALRKYSSGSNLDSKHTEITFSNLNNRNSIDSHSVLQTTENFTDGDRVIIHFNLSEQRNRSHHIDIMESNAQSYHSSAASHMFQSMTATKAEYRTTADGKQEYVGQVPDYAARAYHASQAISDKETAHEYERRADDARRGGPVPLYDFEREIADRTGTKGNAQNFIATQFQEGGKVFKVTRLPQKYFEAMKSLYRRGHVSVAGFVVAAGVGINEYVNGTIANGLESAADSIKQLTEKNEQRPMLNGLVNESANPSVNGSASRRRADPFADRRQVLE